MVTCLSYIENLCNKKILIPKNSLNFFVIKKSDRWNYAIEIELDVCEEIDLFNLYMILKSYVLSNLVLCWKMCVCWKDFDDNLIIIETININKFKKIDLDSFIEWYEWRINQGMDRPSQQNRKDSILSIILIFDKNFIIFKNLDLEVLTPIYPWNDRFIKSIKITNKEHLHQKIKELENKIKILEDTLINERRGRK